MKIKNSMRQTLRPKLVDYIKAAGIPFYPPEIFDCPACGFTASLLPGGLWKCPCGKHGDIVDLAMLAKGYDTEQEAVKAICRLLHIKITQMPIISAEELMDTEFPVSNYLIEKLMGKGLYILAGPPKVGKSWLVLWMAHCISLRLPLWQLQTTQSGVLYVSLEDTPQRIQQRLDKISSGETGDIWFATEAELVGNGLEEQLTHLLKEHPSIRFIVIDTLQRVRPCNGEQYNYGADYEVMCSLKQIADRFGITILAVHHTRKQKSDDVFERISGTTGLMGSADGALVLQKHSRVAQEAVLNVTGRDVPDLRLRLMFDREKSIWRFIGYEGEEPTEYRDVFIGLMATKLGLTWRMTPGLNGSEKLLHLMEGLTLAFQNVLPSFHPFDLLIGIAAAAAIRMAVYVKGKNAKKYRKNMEYGSARWGKPEDIAPFVDPVYEKELASIDELSVLDGSKCILQLRGVRPFKSDKFDITRHKNYKYLSDADERNTFSIEKFLSTTYRPKASEICEVYAVDESNQSMTAD